MSPITLPPDMPSLLDLISDSETKSRTRVLAGRKLAELGDSRPGVGLRSDNLPDIDWVEIPTGEFVYGGDPVAYQSAPEQRIFLPSYNISSYPVTWGQFQTFVEADDGYSANDWWDFPEYTWFQYVRDAKPIDAGCSIPNHPRENVSWFEAVAFCRWLSFKNGYAITLPSEQQWEKAARGTNGRLYPWGNEYIRGNANVAQGLPPKELIYEKDDHRYFVYTTAVGVYVQDRSCYGVFDMAGNVREWCINKPDYQNLELAGKARKVVRGGSAKEDEDWARSACRLWSFPAARGNHLGFRVVCHQK